MKSKKLDKHPIVKIAQEASKLGWDLLINDKGTKVEYLIIGTPQRIEEISELLKSYNPYKKIKKRK